MLLERCGIINIRSHPPNVVHHQNEQRRKRIGKVRAEYTHLKTGVSSW